MPLVFNPYIEICAFAFLLMVTVYYLIKENLFTSQSILYSTMLILTLLTLALDIATAYTITYSSVLPIALNILLNNLLFFFELASAVVFFMFTIALTDGLQRVRRTPFMYQILAIPLLISIVLIILNFNSGMLFYFDSNMVYHRGPSFIYFCIFSMFYVLCGLIYSVGCRKNITLFQLLTIIIFTALFFLSFIFQYYYPRYLITGACLSLGLISMYFTFENPDTYIDGMTKIFGRSAFFVVIGQSAKWRKEPYKIITIDLSGFKAINNYFGIQVGDGILISVVEFLQSICPEKRSLFRIGGDQFALIVSEKKADECISQIRKRFRFSWQSMDNKLQLMASIALISIPMYTYNKEFMMKIIENAIVMAKEKGRSSFINIGGEEIAAIKRRLKIESCLHDFDKNQCIMICFQPIYNVKKKRITSAETLLRMYDKELGLVLPDEFIHIAEALGMTSRIGRYVLNETCKFIFENKLISHGIETVALNISAAECMQQNYTEYAKKIIQSYPFEKSILAIEVTETIAANARAHIADIMTALKPLGISFSLDDYSQGYSNINALTSLPFNTVKLDKEFLWLALESYKADVLFRHTVKMFQDMGLKLIAEGAETEEHVKFLTSLGIDFIQGYYYGKPLSKEEFLEEVLEADEVTLVKKRII